MYNWITFCTAEINTLTHYNNYTSILKKNKIMAWKNIYNTERCYVIIHCRIKSSTQNRMNKMLCYFNKQYVQYKENTLNGYTL